MLWAREVIQALASLPHRGDFGRRRIAVFRISYSMQRQIPGSGGLQRRDQQSAQSHFSKNMRGSNLTSSNAVLGKRSVVVKKTNPASIKAAAAGKAKPVGKKAQAAKTTPIAKANRDSESKIAAKRAPIADQGPSSKSAPQAEPEPGQLTGVATPKPVQPNPRPIPPHQQFLSKGVKPQTLIKGRIIRHQGR